MMHFTHKWNEMKILEMSDLIFVWCPDTWNTHSVCITADDRRTDWHRVASPKMHRERFWRRNTSAMTRVMTPNRANRVRRLLPDAIKGACPAVRRTWDPVGAVAASLMMSLMHDLSIASLSALSPQQPSFPLPSSHATKTLDQPVKS